MALLFHFGCWRSLLCPHRNSQYYHEAPVVSSIRSYHFDPLSTVLQTHRIAPVTLKIIPNALTIPRNILSNPWFGDMMTKVGQSGSKWDVVPMFCPQTTTQWDNIPNTCSVFLIKWS
jgi:hypothetical protein